MELTVQNFLLVFIPAVIFGMFCQTPVEMVKYLLDR